MFNRRDHPELIRLLAKLPRAGVLVEVQLAEGGSGRAMVQRVNSMRGWFLEWRFRGPVTLPDGAVLGTDLHVAVNVVDKWRMPVIDVVPCDNTVLPPQGVQ